MYYYIITDIMYFWNIKKLKQDLVDQRLLENDIFKYLFASTIINSLVIIPFFDNNIWDVYSGILSAIITIIGTHYVYICNKGQNGRNFLFKYFTIGWVVSIRWTILMVIPLMVIYFVIGDILGFISESTTILDALFLNLLLIPYYWIFGKHIKDIA